MNHYIIMKSQLLLIFVLILTSLQFQLPELVQGQESETNIIVRARAADAKFIGSSMGGAMITIRNAQSGEILDFGLTEGSTGNTNLLMRTPKERYMDISSDGAAKFETTLLLNEPTLVTIEASAPQVQPQSTIKATKQLWLIPGKHITGDGIIIEIPGFSVDIVEPRTHSSAPADDKGLTIRANIVMMCGCPTSDGGLWDSNEFDTEAIVYKNHKKVGVFPLSNSENSSEFEGEFKPAEPGVYRITVYAFDPRTGNSGVDKTSVIVR